MARPVPTPPPSDPDIAAFHEHLDACRQCREHPFDLCGPGTQLLFRAARSADSFVDLSPLARGQKPETRSQTPAFR